MSDVAAVENLVKKHQELKDEIDSTYLVVIDRWNDHLVYADVFPKPQGDAFYRYHQIIKDINKF